uniref:NAD-dependent epimerase/dehydratase domain-containing protein n=1 Tax=Helicotheca tamesis TaxID=374047 RepID=A0A7S2IF54_9STRA|mmetsp:Transcript_8669/g.12011  ORF Transcript_8669/g.12011 Transcript_8669/m.12011 type:complete len:390 (+) Transcript_8669:87-1256(+)
MASITIATAPLVGILLNLTLLLSYSRITSAYQVAVFGGSGFIGSRICKILSNVPGCSVISISRSGVPPSWCQEEEWIDDVKWISADAISMLKEKKKICADDDNIDAAVSCVGNVRPSPNWDGFWGLHWDDEVMRRENGDVNVNIAEMSKSLGCRKFVYLSVSYDTAKALEGPLEGYLDGKRDAEEAAYKLFGDDAIVFGPSLVYGGGRFASFGRVIENSLSSPAAKIYQSANNAVRGLSVSNDEDWVTNMVMTPPMHIDIISRAVAAAAVGSLDTATIQPRRQGFYNTEGKPIQMASVPFVDVGDIKRVAEQYGTDEKLAAAIISGVSGKVKEGKTGKLRKVGKWEKKENDPPFEGALVGYKPLLYPLPVAAFFTIAFQWATNIEYPIA